MKSELSILTSQHIAEEVVSNLGVDTILAMPKERTAGEADSSRSAPVPEESAKDSGSDSANSAFDGESQEDAARALHNNAIRMIVQSLGATVNASTIELTFDATSPALAQTILDEIVNTFLDRHVEVHAAQASPEFLQKNLEALAAKLSAHEDQLEAFRQEHHLASLEDQKQDLINATSMLETSIVDARAEEDACQARLTALRDAIRGRDERIETSHSTGTPNAVADALKQQLISLKLDEKELQSLYADSYRPLVELRGKIAQLESSLAQEPATTTQTTIGIDSNYQALELQIETETAALKADEARRKTLTGELAATKEKLQDLSSQEVSLKRLERAVQTAEEEYLRYKDNVSRASSYAALDLARVSNVSVVQEATLPMAPIRPKKFRNLMLGLFLGVFGAVGLACVLDYFDDTLRNDADVEKHLNLPVLTVIPEREYKECI